MTKELRIAFYGEGNTDSRVIPIFVEKIFTSLKVVDGISLIVDPQKWNGRGVFVEVCISLVRQASLIHHLIIFHVDADAPDESEVRKRKISPFYEHIQHQNLLGIPIVWSIPVHAIEAWLLASPEAFARALAADSSRAEELGFPRRPDQIHRDRAKQLFSEGVYTLLAKTQRQRKRIQPDNYHEKVAHEIGLDDLRRLPAFVAFEQDLVRVLADLGYVKES